VFGPLAMVTAWGWLGLLDLAVVRANPGAPAAATGITQTGGYIGAGTGPLVFGFLAHSVSYQAAWAAVAVAMCLAAACMLGAQRQLRRDTNVVTGVVTGAGR
jgi:cyanate permease